VRPVPILSEPVALIEVSGQLYASIAVSVGIQPPGTHCTGSWMGTRLSWDG